MSRLLFGYASVLRFVYTEDPSPLEDHQLATGRVHGTIRRSHPALRILLSKGIYHSSHQLEALAGFR